MRTVGVELRADVSGYDRGVSEAARATRTLEDNISNVTHAAVANAGAMTALDKAMGGSGRAAKAAGHDVSEMRDDLAKLDRQIFETEAALATLAKAYARTGNSSLSREIRSQQSELRKLKTVKSLLPDPADFAKEGAAIGVKVGESIGGGMAKTLPEAGGGAMAAAGPVLIAAGAPIALGLATMLGSALSGAVIGGVGTAGIAGGLVLAARDSRVARAIDDLGAVLTGELEDSAGAFVPAALSAINQVEREFGRLQPEFQRIFTAAAPLTAPLIDGIMGLVRELLPGVQRAIQQAGPIFDVLAADLPLLGKALGDVLGGIARFAPAAATALDLLIKVAAAGINTLGATLDTLLYVYGLIAKTGLLGLQAQASMIGYEASLKAAQTTSDQLSTSTIDTAGGIQQISTAANIAIGSLQELADVSANLAAQNISAAEAALRQREAIIDAARAADKHKRVSNAEETALLSMATAMNSATKTADDLGRSVDVATAAHAANRAELIRVAVRMGYTRQQAIALANKYLAIPRAVSTDVKQPGMAASQQHAIDYKRRLNALDRRINTHVGVTGVDNAIYQLKRLLIAEQSIRKHISISAATSAFNKQELPARAAGGPVVGGLGYLVGERGPEWFRPSVSGTIIPTERVSHYMPASAMASGAMASGTTTITNSPVINIYPVQGQSPQQIAAAVGRELGRMAEWYGRTA